ncbi:phage tail sheath family protein [Alkalispirochaeta alkalica]|uniref:phage tail sheath family protein n=1 Tax=Alkalispirochaeta alkalica TaxID=46356 RepID=UPI0003693945|nr:phage tail sheath subtilisin-like domain-containing protein [Alkalispirochaeta alkalica]
MGSTSIAGFLGVAEKGPVDEVTLVTNWTQYSKIFGGMHSQGWLGHAVYLFFQNGGSKCYINNLAEPKKVAPPKEGAAKGKDGAEGSEQKEEAKPAVPEKMGNPDNLTKLIMGKDEGPGQRTGLPAFDEISDIAIVAAPGVTDPAAMDAILSHCEKNRFRVAVLDAPEVLEKGIDTIPMPRDSTHGSYYFPWVQIFDPNLETEIFVPPSGGIAGVFGRVDGTRGVHKAPANEIFRGATGLRYQLTDGEQELLNPKGVNCIREFSGRGIRVWGARTFSSDPEWRYLNVRRLFCMVEKAIQDGTNWVVFEPNTRGLWKQITRNLTAFCLRLWKDGALFGDSPEEAFFVRCDDELNPPESIDAGYVVCEVGIAPAKPAEFVVFRVSQKTLDE